nr:MAG: hypothetical protein 1 [Bactrocera minax totivirus]
MDSTNSDKSTGILGRTAGDPETGRPVKWADFLRVRPRCPTEATMTTDVGGIPTVEEGERPEPLMVAVEGFSLTGIGGRLGAGWETVLAMKREREQIAALEAKGKELEASKREEKPKGVGKKIKRFLTRGTYVKLCEEEKQKYGLVPRRLEDEGHVCPGNHRDRVPKAIHFTGLFSKDRTLVKCDHKVVVCEEQTCYCTCMRSDIEWSKEDWAYFEAGQGEGGWFDSGNFTKYAIKQGLDYEGRNKKLGEIWEEIRYQDNMREALDNWAHEGKSTIWTTYWEEEAIEGRYSEVAKTMAEVVRDTMDEECSKDETEKALGNLPTVASLDGSIFTGCIADAWQACFENASKSVAGMNQLELQQRTLEWGCLTSIQEPPSSIANARVNTALELSAIRDISKIPQSDLVKQVSTEVPRTGGGIGGKERGEEGAKTTVARIKRRADGLTARAKVMAEEIRGDPARIRAFLAFGYLNKKWTAAVARCLRKKGEGKVVTATRQEKLLLSERGLAPGKKKEIGRLGKLTGQMVDLWASKDVGPLMEKEFSKDSSRHLEEEIDAGADSERHTLSAIRCMALSGQMSALHSRSVCIFCFLKEAGIEGGENLFPSMKESPDSELSGERLDRLVRTDVGGYLHAVAARHNREMHASNGNIDFYIEGKAQRGDVFLAAVARAWDLPAVRTGLARQEVDILDEVRTHFGSTRHYTTAHGMSRHTACYGTLHQYLGGSTLRERFGRYVTDRWEDAMKRSGWEVDVEERVRLRKEKGGAEPVDFGTALRRMRDTDRLVLKRTGSVQVPRGTQTKQPGANVAKSMGRSVSEETWTLHPEGISGGEAITRMLVFKVPSETVIPVNLELELSNMSLTAIVELWKELDFEGGGQYGCCEQEGCVEGLHKSRYVGIGVSGRREHGALQLTTKGQGFEEDAATEMIVGASVNRRAKDICSERTMGGYVLAKGIVAKYKHHPTDWRPFGVKAALLDLQREDFMSWPSGQEWGIPARELPHTSRRIRMRRVECIVIPSAYIDSAWREGKGIAVAESVGSTATMEWRIDSPDTVVVSIANDMSDWNLEMALATVGRLPFPVVEVIDRYRVYRPGGSTNGEMEDYIRNASLVVTAEKVKRIVYVLPDEWEANVEIEGERRPVAQVNLNNVVTQCAVKWDGTSTVRKMVKRLLERQGGVKPAMDSFLGARYGMSPNWGEIQMMVTMLVCRYPSKTHFTKVGDKAGTVEVHGITSRAGKASGFTSPKYIIPDNVEDYGHSSAVLGFSQVTAGSEGEACSFPVAKIGKWSNMAELGCCLKLLSYNVFNAENEVTLKNGIHASSIDTLPRGAYLRRAYEEWALSNGIGDAIINPKVSGEYAEFLLQRLEGEGKEATSLRTCLASQVGNGTIDWSWAINYRENIRVPQVIFRLGPDMYRNTMNSAIVPMGLRENGYRLGGRGEVGLRNWWYEVEIGASDNVVVERALMRLDVLKAREGWKFVDKVKRKVFEGGSGMISIPSLTQLAEVAGWKEYSVSDMSPWGWGMMQRYRDFTDHTYRSIVLGSMMGSILQQGADGEYVWCSRGASDGSVDIMDDFIMDKAEGFHLPASTEKDAGTAGTIGRDRLGGEDPAISAPCAGEGLSHTAARGQAAVAELAVTKPTTEVALHAVLPKPLAATIPQASQKDNSGTAVVGSIGRPETAAAKLGAELKEGKVELDRKKKEDTT